MIIELAKEFADFGEAEWQPYHEAVENLLQAHRHGWHIFAPARRISDSIHLHCMLSKTQKEILDNYVKAKFAILVGQAKTADFTILAIPNSGSQTPERNNQIIIPLAAYKDPQFAMPTRLLTENSEIDGRYLKWVAKATAQTLGFSKSINIELLHGGGSTMAAELERKWNDTRPLICVVDSDRRYPNGPLGDTAKAIQKVGNINQAKTVEVHILNVREVENLVPISMLFSIYKENADVLNIVGRIHDYLSHADCKKSKFRVCDYFDLKDGIAFCDVAKMPEQAKAEFVKFCRHMSTEKCDAARFEDNSDDNKISSGVSKNMLRTTLDFLEKNPRIEVEFAQKLIDAPFWTSVEPVIKKILCFSVAGERLPI
jgi:hypothetical protein